VKALKFKTMIAAICAGLALSLPAQVEVPTAEQMSGWLDGYKALCAATPTEP
jgi:outer membrane lipoprotein-sorting protein